LHLNDELPYDIELADFAKDINHEIEERNINGGSAMMGL